jgi:hypothetical protein
MSIKQNGGVFGRNPTFNDVTIEGQLTFDGDIDINSDLKIDGDLEVTGTSYLVGNVGVGTGSPDNPLMIESTTDAMLRFTRTGVRSWREYIGSTGNLIIRDLSGTPADRLSIDTTGNVNVLTGNLAFASGKGIDFSATGTGTSELFDDYEEGDFTPVVSDAASGGNNASGYASQVGKYTKVGRMVHFTIKIQNINTSGMTSGNDVFVTGLPFTSSSASNCMCSTLITGITFTGRVEAMVLSGQSYLKLTEVASGASFEDLITVGELTSGTADIFFNGSYFV